MRGPRSPWWAKALLVILILVLIAGAAYAGVAIGRMLGASESRDTQVIRSIEREEQIILVSAGQADVKEERRDGVDFLDLGLFTVPGTERALLMRYEYDAKYGIEGGDVKINPDGNGGYRISIPEFVFLGYANPNVEVASESNGLLSWTTPEIDQGEVIEKILTDEAVATHIDGIRQVLQEQAQAFYSNIVLAIEPEARLTFTFAG